MPKRPTRVAVSLEVPPDLAATDPERPQRALATELGELVCGDAVAVLAALPDGAARLVVADPPYVAWCDRWLAEVHRVLAPDGSAYVCGFSEILAEVKVRSARRFASCRWLIWSYRNKANLGRDWGRSHESILHLRRAATTRIDIDAVRVPYNGHTTRYPARSQAINSQYGGGRPRGESWQPHPLGAKPRDVIEIPVLCNGMSEKTEHPTQKPEELIRRLVQASSAPGDLVVDPFAGSGTTAVVCEATGRRWLAGERDARYVGMARTRIGAAATAAAASM
jgi:site-specific DNA-methyltransferase (adenine-specific)